MRVLKWIIEREGDETYAVLCETDEYGNNVMPIEVYDSDRGYHVNELRIQLEPDTLKVRQ